jgi:hypothetical protein
MELMLRQESMYRWLGLERDHQMVVVELMKYTL